MRYDHGPSRIEPSRPIVDLSAGRTRCTEDEPVMPKTTNATAASVGDSFHDGLGCVVHAQNFAYNDEEDEDDSVLRPRRAERASAREERVKSVAMFAASARRGRATWLSNLWRVVAGTTFKPKISKTPVRSASGSSP